MSVERFYRFTCDGCGKTEDKEDDMLPERWGTVCFLGMDRDGDKHYCPTCIQAIKVFVEKS